jgi:hypothetical protein
VIQELSQNIDSIGQNNNAYQISQDWMPVNETLTNTAIWYLHSDILSSVIHSHCLFDRVSAVILAKVHRNGTSDEVEFSVMHSKEMSCRNPDDERHPHRRFAMVR